MFGSVGDAYDIFAAMLTQRPWEQVRSVVMVVVVVGLWGCLGSRYHHQRSWAPHVILVTVSPLAVKLQPAPRASLGCACMCAVSRIVVARLTCVRSLARSRLLPLHRCRCIAASLHRCRVADPGAALRPPARGALCGDAADGGGLHGQVRQVGRTCVVTHTRARPTAARVPPLLCPSHISQRHCTPHLSLHPHPCLCLTSSTPRGPAGRSAVCCSACRGRCCCCSRPTTACAAWTTRWGSPSTTSSSPRGSEPVLAAPAAAAVARDMTELPASRAPWARVPAGMAMCQAVAV